MKLKNFFMTAAVFAAASFTFTGCDDKEDDIDGFSYPGNPNANVVSQLATTTEPIIYQATYRARFLEKIEGTQNKWKDWDMTYILFAYNGTGPSTIIFKGGKVEMDIWTVYNWPWSHYTKNYLSDQSGELSKAWLTYRAKHGPCNIHIVSDFKYDKKSKEIYFDGEKFGLISCETDELVISTLGDDYYRTWEYYTSTTEYDEPDLIFNSRKEAYTYIFDLVHKEFGDAIIPDEITDFEVPIHNAIDLKEVQKWLETL